MTARTHRYVVVQDSLERARDLRRRLAGRRDVVVIDPLPDPSDTRIDEAILAGLGKDPLLTTMKRRPGPLADAWLSLGEHRDAVVLDAQLLTDGELDALATRMTGHGIRVWFVIGRPAAATYDPRVEQLVEHVATTGATPADTTRLHRVGRATPATVEPRVVRVPRVDGLVFRDACRRLLAAEDFARVDASFVAQVREIRDRLGSISSRAQTRVVRRMLRRAIENAADTEELVVAVRAFQVACMTEGWHCTVATPVLLGAASAIPRRGRLEIDGVWDDLDGYRDPEIGAVAALYHHGLTLEAALTLTFDDLQPVDATSGRDALTIRIPDEPIAEESIADEAIMIRARPARFLRALSAYRRATGAAAGDRLFAPSRRETPTLRWARQMLHTPLNDLGLGLALTAPPRSAHPDVAYLARYGITLAGLRKADHYRRSAPDRADRGRAA